MAINMFFKGITEKVDYFKSINVGAVWLSPIFQSPQDDFGYDVSNFKMVDPLFGTMADFDRLRDAFHERGTYDWYLYYLLLIFVHEFNA